MEKKPSDEAIPKRKRPLNDEPLVIVDDPADDARDIERMEKGMKIFKIISENYPDWNEIEVQETIFSEIDRCSRNKIDLKTEEILTELSVKFDAEYVSMIPTSRMEKLIDENNELKAAKLKVRGEVQTVNNILLFKIKTSHLFED